MNQIILVKQVNQLHKTLFKMQFVVSMLVLILLGGYSFVHWKKEQELQKVSQLVNQAFALETVYFSEKNSMGKQTKYFGKITIPKINLEYNVFNECDDELLKILPCKFYGVNMGEKGNICIAGHNYNDERFFGQLQELKIGDAIYLSDSQGKNDQYIIYDKYKVKPDDFSCLKATRKYDLTLVTCDNINGKRLIIKAGR